VLKSTRIFYFIYLYLIYIFIIYILFQNIEKEIKEHLKGDAILTYYKNNGILNEEARGILVEILASCIIKINITLYVSFCYRLALITLYIFLMLLSPLFFCSPTFKEFLIVSKKICELFPTETEVKLLYLYN